MLSLGIRILTLGVLSIWRGIGSISLGIRAHIVLVPVGGSRDFITVPNLWFTPKHSPLDGVIRY